MSPQPESVRLLLTGFFLAIGFFVFVGCSSVGGSDIAAPGSAINSPFCVEILLRGKPFAVMVEHSPDGRDEKTGYEDSTCDNLGEKVRIEWSDYLGLFPIRQKEYYPRRLREPVPTWYWIGTLNHFEPPDLDKAFEILAAEGQVQLTMRYQYDSEAYQCDQGGANCERNTEHDEFEGREINFKIVERTTLTIGGGDYEAWVVEWYYGKIVYSPQLKIPLRTYEYNIDSKDPGPHLVSEVISVHR